MEPSVFLRYQIARSLWIFALQAQGVAVSWQIYASTGQAMDLGYVGLAQFLPAMLLWPVAGAMADRFDRRWIAAGCGIVHLLAAAALSLGPHPIPVALGLLCLSATARAISAPSFQSLLPALVSAEQFPRALAVNSTIFQLGATLGPALGGFLYGSVGPAATYRVSAAMLAGAAAMLLTLPGRAGAAGGTAGSAALAEGAWDRALAGLRFVRARPALLGAIGLDMVAVLLGGAVALLPIFAQDILRGGPELLGMLRAAPAVGATLMAITLAARPIRRHAGPILLGAVCVFGAATVVFGLSRSVPLSLAALACLGAADEISVVIRQVVVQLNTPDHLRGRVSAVNFLFISVSNEVGQFESGLTASWWGPVRAALFGGFGSILSAILFGIWFPELRRLDRLVREEQAPAEQEK